jgi:23S rRNA pseudouridine2604 synthase
MSSNGIQINKYISSTGYCSRREADKLVEQARVMINDDIALPSSRVEENDIVFVDDELLKKKKSKSVYIAFNKPAGITTTTDLSDKTNVISYLKYSKRIFPIGRLDKDSEGLLLLTDDGDIVNKILRAGNNHEKEYVVTVDKAIQNDFAEKMSNGIPILGTKTLKCKVRVEGSKRFRIILKQGLNRQIRRMCEYLGYEVTSLTRIRIMNIKLDKIQLGKWRYLTPSEFEEMQIQLRASSK